MKSQIVKIIETEGLTPTRFADEIGVQRSSISHIISGRNMPSYDFIQKIINRFPGINVEWLITGHGSMIKSGNITSEPQFKNQTLFTSKIPEKKESEDLEKKDFLIKPKIPSEDIIVRQSEPIKYSKKEVTDVNNVDFILVFYTDGTFKRFKERE